MTSPALLPQSGCFQPRPRKALPLAAPVSRPFSNSSWPFTNTYFTPSDICAGF
jgi:hypothetical protein